MHPRAGSPSRHFAAAQPSPPHFRVCRTRASLSGHSSGALPLKPATPAPRSRRRACVRNCCASNMNLNSHASLLLCSRSQTEGHAHISASRSGQVVQVAPSDKTMLRCFPESGTGGSI